jgi:hypothetical protein
MTPLVTGPSTDPVALESMAVEVPQQEPFFADNSDYMRGVVRQELINAGWDGQGRFSCAFDLVKNVWIGQVTRQRLS